MAFVWQDKENGVDDILAEHINDVAHEVIRLEEDKANNDLSNVNDNVFKNKALSAGIEGKVLSVNGKIGNVTLIPSDIGACTTDEVEELINSSHSAVVFPRFNKIDSDIDNINKQIAEKVDKAQEIFEEELDTIILTNNQPKLFKVSKTSIGMISAFNPYYVYYGEISPLVDGKTTHLYQYKITGTGIYFRTGTRQPISPEQSWQEWTKIGSGGGGGGGAVSSVNGKVGDVVLSANDVEAYSQIPGINITGRGIEVHSNSDKNIVLFTYRDDGSFAVHDLSQKADKATTLSGYGITDVYTKGETDSQIGAAIESTSIYKADRDLSNVPNEYFLAKLNSVLPNGDEVSY